MLRRATIVIFILITKIFTLKSPLIVPHFKRDGHCYVKNILRVKKKRTQWKCLHNLDQQKSGGSRCRRERIAGGGRAKTRTCAMGCKYWFSQRHSCYVYRVRPFYTCHRFLLFPPSPESPYLSKCTNVFVINVK